MQSSQQHVPRQWQQCWLVLKPYWTSEEWLFAWILLIITLLLPLITPIVDVYLNQQQGNLISAAVARDIPRLSATFLNFLGSTALSTLLSIGSSYFANQLQNNWRRWMTVQYLETYFGERNYYHLTGRDIDNPDQRVQEDINTFTNQALQIPTLVINSFSGIAAASVALWLIFPPLLFTAIIYALIGTVIAVVFFGKTLNRLNFQQFKKEANFRFGLIRVRDRAESIAFYQGETQEANEIDQRFDAVVANRKQLINWLYAYLRAYDAIYSNIPTVFTVLILAPRILTGGLEVGAFQVGRANVNLIRNSFAIGIVKLGDLTQLTAAAQRLATLLAAMDRHLDIPAEGQRQIDVTQNGTLAISHLTLQTPDYQRTLLSDLSIEIPQGSKLLVMGESGCGKSSLLRALAGLWNSGTGHISRPEFSQMLFLPQRPYMIEGTLREQLLYPNTNPDVTQEQLYEVLKAVNLSDLPKRIDDFDRKVDLTAMLSLGEQQRLAFARLLLFNPNYAILDESTSALDLKNEHLLYQQLASRNITVLSVGHRPTLVKYHSLVLQLKKDQSWQLIPAASFNSED